MRVLSIQLTFITKVLEWIARDRHYCLVLPAMIPAGFVYVLFNWFGFKYFKHN
jgi:hypothetical protein